MISVQNRVPNPGQEGRVLITPESGAPFYATLAMADGATQLGTPWNRLTGNLLQADIRSYPVARGQSVTAGQVVDVSDVPPAVGQYVAGNIQMQNVPVGGIITRTENGVPQYYIVVHQGLPSAMYDASCNGTWVLRLDIYAKAAWDAGNSNVLPGADIFATMAGMLSLFDAETQAAIKTVKIPYCVGDGSSTVQSGADGLECKIFPLGCYEIGLTQSDVVGIPIDGVKLEYFDGGTEYTALQKRISYENNVKSIWYLRSSDTKYTNRSWAVFSGGTLPYSVGAANSYGIRPAFVLDSTLEVDGYYENVETALLTSGTPSQAIALQSGSAGDVIDVIFSGMTELSGVTQGQQITSAGVQGFGVLDGWLSVAPYWFVNAKIATGSYTGTGTYGGNNPNKLVFPFIPKFIAIDGIVSNKHNSGIFNGLLINNVGSGFASSWISILGNDIHCISNYATYASLNGNNTSGWTLSFYNIHDAVSQLNNKGTDYYYVAIG